MGCSCCFADLWQPWSPLLLLLVELLAWRRAYPGSCSCGHISMAVEILCPSTKTGAAES